MHGLNKLGEPALRCPQPRSTFNHHNHLHVRATPLLLRCMGLLVAVLTMSIYRSKAEVAVVAAGIRK